LTGIVTVKSAFFGIVQPSGRREDPGRAFPLDSQSIVLGDGAWTLSWSAFGPSASLHHEGRSGLAFLGEIYNADELCGELGVGDNLSPAEVLFHAREHWSDEFFSRLDCIGVLACWDDGRLTLYRDGSAARNLYHTCLPDGRIAFATHLDLLFRLPGTTRRISRPSLHEYLRFLDISAPNTLFDGVRALEPGHCLAWADGKITVGPIVGADADHPRASSLGEAVDTLEVLLQESIGRRLAGLSRPAVFLSGGVDSSIVCALAGRVSPKATAVTVGFEGARYDEAPVAGAVAAHLGMRHEVLRFDRAQYLRSFEAFNGASEQPFADPAAPPTLLAFEHCLERFDAAFDSSGADESVGVMPPRHARIGMQYADLLPLGARRLLVAAMGRVPWLREYTPIFDFEHPAEFMIRWKGFTRPEVERLCHEPVSFDHTHFFQLYSQFPRSAHFERCSALEDAMPNDRIHQAGGMTGLSVRFPYFERDVDAYIRALPMGYRYAPSAPKRILRELLARHVPRRLWDSPKRGFDFPLREFMAADDFALVRRFLDAARWREWQLLDPDGVAEYGRRFIAGEASVVFRVWALAVLASWLEGHGAG
jgi:asparagine synthase (glutamine-hydrolysing)